MISTRQIIIIINMVLFLVNPAISGDKGKSSSSIFSLFGKKKKPSNEETSSSEYKEVTSEDLDSCLFELNVAFKNEDTFDNFEHAFLYLNSRATAEYYFDLLYIAQEMDKPYLMDPKAFCKDRYGYDGIIFTEDDCIRSIGAIGCGTQVAVSDCVENLYFTLNKDELLVAHGINPNFEEGTEDISDNDLETAVQRGISKYRGLSESELLIRLSDKRIRRDYYKGLFVNDPYYDFYAYNATDEELTKYEEAQKHMMYEYGRIMFGRYRGSSSNDQYEEFYNLSEYDSRRYRVLRDCNGNVLEEHRYLSEARDSFYGIPDLPYKTLYSERTRRHRLLKQYDYQYIMYLIREFKKGDRSNFVGRVEFCLDYLRKHPNYC